MKAVIPAAGIGTRLRPHTHTLPKALLYVAGRPIISHILDEVRELNPSGVVLIIGYKGDLIKDYVTKEYPDLKIDFVYQAERNGIAHALHMTRDVADTGEPLLVILGDTIIKADLKRIVESKTNSLGVCEVEDPRRFGVVEVSGNDIVRLVEKPKNPPSKLAIVGLYYLTDAPLLYQMIQEQIDKDIKSHGEYQVTDALQMMIDKGAKFRTFEIDDWFDCGKPEALLETNRKLLEGNGQAVDINGSIVIQPVSIAPSATITNSIIGPYVSVAADSTVENSIIRDSVLDRGAHVTDCLLDGSIIGSRAVVKGRVQQLNIGDSSEVVSK